MEGCFKFPVEKVSLCFLYIFCNNSEIDKLSSKQLYVENKVKLSQLEIANKKYCGGGVLSFQLREFSFVLYI